MKIEVKLTLKIGLGIDLCRYKSDPKVYSHAWSVLPSYTPLLNQLFCLRADDRRRLHVGNQLFEFEPVPLCRNQYQIGHLQFSPRFCFKARLSAKQLACYSNFYSLANKNGSFSQERFALSLVLKARVLGTRKYRVFDS